MGTKQNAVPSNTIFVYIDVFLHLVILCIDWWLNFASTTNPKSDHNNKHTKVPMFLPSITDSLDHRCHS